MADPGDPGSLTRRGALAALLSGGTTAATLTPLDTLFERLAPLSGRAWESAGRVPERVPNTVEGKYGPATVTYDDYHVPHVEADDEAAAYFAVGYAQAADRLFQMDLLRRDGSGRLAEVFGEFGVDRDVLRAKVDAEAAIEASLTAIQGSGAERMLEAYADGVTAYVERGPPGVEFGLFDYEPEPWSKFDTMAVAIAMYFQQTWGASALREEVRREAFDEETYRTLFPTHVDHDAPVLRDGSAGDGRPASEPDASQGVAVDPTLVDWLGEFGSSGPAGSNAWTVSGEHTESGDPILCSDPHFSLGAPPLLYRQHLAAGEVDVGGATVPGIPFVFVGETDHCAWGYTTGMGDVLDFYTYEVREARSASDRSSGDEPRDDGDQYRYGDEWHAFERDAKTVEVRDPISGETETREVEVKKTVHGPFLEREVDGETHHVGVAWTPLTGNRTAEAMYEWSHAESVAEFRAATRKWDAIPGNVHVVDRQGGTCYQFAAPIPIRRVDDEVIRGNRVFDGSAGEAEWEGFEPYGQSTWEGFVPFEDLPAAIDADYVASANQRPVDEPPYPLGTDSFSGFRAQRIYEVLDETVGAGETVDRDDLRSLQLDALDVTARELVPAILDARDRMPEAAQPWVDELADWDYRMHRDSAAALVYHRTLEHFQEATWQDEFEQRGLARRYWPRARILLSLPADSEFFDGDRGAVVADAMERAVAEIDEEGWETYGDFNRLQMDHRLGQFVSGLNYPRHATDGSGVTVRMNSDPSSPWGATVRLLCDLGGDSEAVLAGGNDGSPFSEHYHDQLPLWADGEYEPLGAWPDGDPDVTVEGEDG
ncbi:peptidase S45 [Halobacteriales archaeon QS_1_68_20]|nr:MAG: peptidase S45 [Halobacteriales archaeon QS_1_68_20]